jgi:rhamnosyltransferase
MPLFKIAAYITAYEDSEAINACLKALQQQTYPIDKIFVVDNSRQALSLVADARLVVFHHPENVGIAAGIGIALSQAQQAGHDFLWMFDQDSQPTATCLEVLLKSYAELSQQTSVGIVAPSAIDQLTGATIDPVNFCSDRFRSHHVRDAIAPFACDAPITSGSLLYLKTDELVPPPDPRLFMDGVDFDYGMRLQQAGLHHFIVPSALMHHRFGTPISAQLMGQTRTFQIYSARRYYYVCRNHTYLELAYAQGFKRISCRWWRVRYMLSRIMIVLLFSKDLKLPKIKACLIGTYDGLQGNLERRWE